MQNQNNTFGQLENGMDLIEATLWNNIGGCGPHLAKAAPSACGGSCGSLLVATDSSCKG